MSLKNTINEDMKNAMRAKDSAKLATLRLILAALKQKEVDERVELNDADVIAILDKMIKQRRDSVTQYEAGGRQDLADQEKFEIGVLQTYMPQALSEAEVAVEIEAAIVATGAKSAADMGKVMGILKPKLAGRTDLGKVSGLVKAKLAG